VVSYVLSGRISRRWKAGRVIPGLLAMLIAFVFLLGVPSSAATAHGDQLWLVVSDIHLNVFASSDQPSAYAFDTNRALFNSALTQMRRAAPHPALVLLPGDFLMHDFAEQARRHSVMPDAAALRTMEWIAGRFSQVFPNAQFAIALGNNDVPCGDYKSADGSRYLAAVARAWAPLIDRHGAARDFTASFSRSGYYTTRLPVAGLRLVVLNSVPLSSEYRGTCGMRAPQNAATQLSWLSKTLGSTPPNQHNIVMMHIPPGFDAFSTDYVRGLVAWRFLSPRYDAALVAALDAPRNRVAYAIAGHTHRFDFRFADGVPIVVFGSLSPIYANNPAFYVLRVRSNGALHDIDVRAFDETDAAWLHPLSFDRAWSLPDVGAASLERLHARLAKAPALRPRWYRQSGGWLSNAVIKDPTWAASWRISWCAQDLTARDYAHCAGLRKRLLVLPSLGALIVVVAVVLVSLALLHRLRVGIGTKR
jgi:sphingomyelin phosphodiesterase acid-like 3